ncbi:MAG TPA: sodium:panthothenate symporter [Lentisphaeria bacterium]|uniref:sodium:solute symporter family transporter n=2 Tax=Victivallis TaxID=172900 RepID=UPI000E8E790E|nr:sodium:panthothenate symporter [Victivallis lenta]HBP07783.1 sodium:panthothenate symporter [Lentisphaeria bacterium]HCH85758.1 sodium:panthothenate symporter [Lentisphaeria bacterium]
MTLLDWLIVTVPVLFVMGMGFYSRKYVKSVADFLVAGRLCGRYVISVGDVANALAIIGLVAYVEAQYKTGFALSFWNGFAMPLSIVIALTGYCTYRFRETRAMSLGQFLEMRYSRPLRIFAATLRSLSEMLANMIMPAVAARFFIYFFDLPERIGFFGCELPTFMLLVVLVLVMAITLICCGGTLTLVITDAIQGMFCYPLLVVMIVFVLYRFSWSTEIVPVMMDRVAGESFLNPFDVDEMRDFNVFMLVVTFTTMIVHQASWIGAGITSAAKSPHEQKMAGLLGTWRNMLGVIFYLLVAVAVIVVLNHGSFSHEAREIRTRLSTRIADGLVPDDGMRSKLVAGLRDIPEQKHVIGRDAPLADRNNLDTAYLETVHRTLQETGNGNAVFQEFRTLYYQLMLPVAMRELLPPVILGLFALLLVLAMLSTDDTRIYSASLTITQDVIVPLCGKPLRPESHIRVIRLVSIGVGVFFFCGSYFMSQLDYINLFVTLMTSIWLGGCAPVMIFGLYSRFGTTAGAFTSLITGMVMAVGGVLIQRNWADTIYPFLDGNGLAVAVGNALETLSGPFQPWIVWKMDAVKCPVNSYEFYFLTMIVTFVLYCLVSYATCREPFNLDRMLHRGKYAIDGTKRFKLHWSPREFFANVIGITPEYTRGDRVIAWGLFGYSFVYSFCLAFLGVLLWNLFSPWPLEWWGHYFFVVQLAIPLVLAAVTTVWFGIGGVRDLFRLFRDLESRTAVNDLDNGVVEGHMSLADKAELESVDRGGRRDAE